MENNNQYQIKLELAKKFLAEYQQKLSWWKNDLLKANEEYIGETLKARKELLNRWLLEDNVKVEALAEYIKNIEEFEKMDAYTTKAEELENNKK